MLNRLYIRNYALIDTVDVRFGAGLNLLTGETGAGKSIILGALSLIMGQRAESRFLFNEAKKCVIEGHFDISRYGLDRFFEEQDIDLEQETIIRREFSADGKSRAFINDTPVTLSVLKLFSSQLIDIHSQHATQQVATMDFQLVVLDSVADCLDVRKEFRSTLDQYRHRLAELQALIRKNEEEAAESDYKQYLFDELDAAALESGEVVRLEEERDQLAHAEDIQRGIAEALDLLRGREANVEAALAGAAMSLEKVAPFMPSLSDFSERLRSTWIEAKDIGDELSGRIHDIQVDDRRLQFIHDRLDQLYHLQQKHRLDHADLLLNRREELRTQLHALTDDRDQIDLVRGECERLEDEVRQIAERLRVARLASIPVIEENVREILVAVGMPDGRLSIELQALGPGEYRLDGNDSVVFKFTSNKGQAPQPVGKVASGGELSRLMLAIKTLMASHSALPTIIFDEIDTGISGEVALRVGDVLEQMGERMQVIVITHLPQIAAKRALHYRVYKSLSGERTTTNIQLLDKKDRVLEIAQMLSGADPGESAMDHARILLERSR